MVGLLDGTRSLGEVWDIAKKKKRETGWVKRAPTQDEAIRLLGNCIGRRCGLWPMYLLTVANYSGVISAQQTDGRQTERVLVTPWRARAEITQGIPDRFLTATLPFVGRF